MENIQNLQSSLENIESFLFPEELYLIIFNPVFINYVYACVRTKK
jgi:hypothetical protein